MSGVDMAERGPETVPVRDLRASEGVSLGVGHPARDRLAMEIFELRGQLLHDARFARVRWGSGRCVRT